MDREKANNVLRNAGDGSAGIYSFARCNQETIENIEKMTTEDVEREMHSAYWLAYVYGQFSIRDLQYVELLSLELDSRGWDEKRWEEFREWAKKEEYKLDEAQQESLELRVDRDDYCEYLDDEEDLPF